MGYEELYKDKEYCFSELLEARRIFSTKPLTFKKGDLILKGLAIMLFHCPEEIIGLVEATISELDMRMKYATFI